MPNRDHFKKLMILGAGLFQAPGIRKAVGLGHYVISVDNRPESIGHKYSHQYLNCSTVERETLASQAEKLGIDGICTFGSDIAVPSVGYVRERLGLPGVSFAVAQSMSRKDRFREAQRQATLPHPTFIVVRSAEELPTVSQELRFPLVFKPVDSSGSRGVRILHRPRVEEMTDAFAFANSFSSSGRVCVEEFVGGTEFGGDGILRDGELVFLAITEKRLQRFVVTGHCLPPALTGEKQDLICKALEECCSAVGYTNGPLNFDIKIAADQVTVLEMSARNGGNGIPAIIKRATGVDVEEATIRLALGEGWHPLPAGDFMRAAGSLVLGSPIGGMLKRVGSFKEVKQSVPELAELNFAVSVGDPVGPFEHNGNSIGYAVFDYQPPNTYADVAARIREALDIQVEADGA